MSVWNPWHGCTRLSSGCKGCVVFRVDAAHGRNTELVRKTRAFDLPVRKDRNREYKLRPEDGGGARHAARRTFSIRMPIRGGKRHGR